MRWIASTVILFCLGIGCAYLASFDFTGVDTAALEAAVRHAYKPLQYILFFCALALFGALELVAKRSQKTPGRGHRWPLNYVLTALAVAAAGIIPVSHLVAVDYARDNGIGLLNAFAVGPIAAISIGIFFRSFVAWGMHLAMHKVRLLWRVHRIHHTDTFLDVSSTLRFHPLEFVLRVPVYIAASVAMGVPPLALMLYELFGSAQGVLIHANVRFPHSFERLLQWIFVTPAMHRVHHAAWQPRTDSNYGAVFSIWDRLFGTYRKEEPATVATMELGLSECQDARALSLWWLLALPLKSVRISELLKPSKHPKDCVNKRESAAALKVAGVACFRPPTTLSCVNTINAMTPRNAPADMKMCHKKWVPKGI